MTFNYRALSASDLQARAVDRLLRGDTVCDLTVDLILQDNEQQQEIKADGALLTAHLERFVARGYDEGWLCLEQEEHDRQQQEYDDYCCGVASDNYFENNFEPDVMSELS